MGIKNDSMGVFCDGGIVFSLCVVIFVLPASIALIDSFAALAVFFYLIKKLSCIVNDWPKRTAHLNLSGKIISIWTGFAPPVNCLNLPLQFMTLMVFMSVLFSQYPTHSLIAFFGKYIKYLFVYFSFIEAFSDKRRIMIFLNIFFLSAFITALSGAVQHFTGRDFLKGHTIGTENFISTHRISSSFFGANGFGVYLLLVIGLATHFVYTLIFRHKSWILGGVLASFLVLLLANLCWTYSRSSWLGFLVFLFVMVLLDWRKIFYITALILVFVFIFMPSLNHVRHQTLISDHNDGVQTQKVKAVLEQGGSGRIIYWKKAISVICSSPIWGIGLNNYSKFVMRDPNPKNWSYAHNSFLQMAAETGVLGLACFLWMLFVLFSQGLENCKQIKDLWPLTILQATVSGLSGFLVQSFFDNTLYAVQLAMLMWLFFGLMVAVMSKSLR